MLHSQALRRVRRFQVLSHAAAGLPLTFLFQNVSSPMPRMKQMPKPTMFHGDPRTISRTNASTKNIG